MGRYLALVALLAAALPAAAQTAPPPTIDTTPVDLSGPRVGVTGAFGNRVVFSGEGFVEDYEIPAVFAQFGWQFERRMFQREGGLSGVIEFVPLIGVLEQGRFLPSLSFLVGLRAPSGLEFGLGPNLSPAGPAYAVGVGVNNSFDGINVPVNVSASLPTAASA